MGQARSAICENVSLIDSRTPIKTKQRKNKERRRRTKKKSAEGEKKRKGERNGWLEIHSL